MKSLDELPRYCRELIATHDALWKLGFSTEDMYVGCDGVVGIGQNVLFLMLATQGKEFVYTIGSMGDKPREEVFSEWEQAMEWKKVAPQDELERCFRESAFGNIQHFTLLVGTLAKRGFEMPELVKRGHGKNDHEVAAALWGAEPPPMSRGGSA